MTKAVCPLSVDGCVGDGTWACWMACDSTGSQARVAGAGTAREAGISGNEQDRTSEPTQATRQAGATMKEPNG